jgi:hypothetical protein
LVIPGQERSLLVALFALLAIVLLAACAGAEEAASPAQGPAGTVEPQPPPATAHVAEPQPPPPAAETAGAGEALPSAVVQTREAIVEAAHAFDYDGLEALLDPASFSYSFGESGDPIGYWRRLEEVGEVPILGDFLPVVLSMGYAKKDDIYVWPAAFAKKPSQWTAADLGDMRILYTDEDIRGFEQAGGYLGYRVGIREDGTWLFFVAGD